MIYKSGTNPKIGQKKSIESILSGEQHPMWGKSHSIETKNKIKSSLLGRTHSPETKQKMVTAANNKPMIECTHCSLQSKSIGNMNRYHFDNCKFKGEN
jgi:hypothetical protein